MWEMNTNKVKKDEWFQIEIVKQGRPTLLDYVIDLFNHVVCIGFSQAWFHHTIHLIQKLGVRFDLNQYRTIMVGHTLFKLYVTTLHLRLSKELKRRHIQARG